MVRRSLRDTRDSRQVYVGAAKQSANNEAILR